MFEYLLISFCTFIVSLISFYSGFGLGTLLMPVIAIFFPIPIAITITAVIHLIHNLIKSSLLWRAINWKVVLKFGSCAIIAAIPGALALKKLSIFSSLKNYSLGGIHAEISILHIFLGLLLIFFATFEILSKKRLEINNLYIGGVLSGFFGGLSGFQGALRSVFLINTKLEKNTFLGTNAIIGVVVDFSRLIIYNLSFYGLLKNIPFSFLLVAVLSGLLAILIGMFFLKKITITFIQKLIVVLLYFLGILLIFGVI